MRTLFSALVVVTVCANFPLQKAGAAITSMSSALNLNAEANAGIGLVQNTQSVAQTFGLNPLSASVFAQAFNGTLSATTESDATATWSSADTGQFSVHDSFVTDDLSAYPGARVATGDRPTWVYTFSSDAPAILTLDYVINHSGPAAYATDIFFNQMIGSSVETGSFVKQVIFGIPPTSGIATFSIDPYVIYTFSMFDNSNLNQNFPAINSDMNATFSFQIAPVPEPSGFTIVALGTMALRYLRRRQKGAQAQPRHT